MSIVPDQEMKQGYRLSEEIGLCQKKIYKLLSPLCGVAKKSWGSKESALLLEIGCRGIDLMINEQEVYSRLKETEKDLATLAVNAIRLHSQADNLEEVNDRYQTLIAYGYLNDHPLSIVRRLLAATCYLDKRWHTEEAAKGDNYDYRGEGVATITNMTIHDIAPMIAGNGLSSEDMGKKLAILKRIACMVEETIKDKKLCT